MRQRPGAVSEKLEAANAESSYKVSKDQLPLHCPMPDSYLWNSHPKVFLSIEDTGEAVCPYCSAHYVLIDQQT